MFSLALSIFGNAVYADNCGGAVTCSCGDTLNESYIMPGNLIGCSGNGLLINVSNIVLDCNGYSITGSSSESGVFINSDNNIMQNCTINGFNEGVNINGTNTTVYHNNIYSNTLGVNSTTAIALWYNNEGNYWGHDSCPVFIPFFDTNAFNVVDVYAYKTLNGWLTESPFDCPPMWANPSNYTPSSYSSTPSQFNITWGDEFGVDKVFITIMNSTGVLVNNASMTNDTYGGFIYNYSIVLPAGTFNWTSYANDSAGNWSNSNTWTFTIGKGPTEIKLWLNNIEGNKSYNLNDIANFTASLNLTNRVIYLNSSCPSWTNLSTSNSFANNTTTLTCSGLFFVNAYWNGDENYLTSSTTYYFDNIAPQYFIVSPGSSDTYDFNKTYWFNISVSAATINKTILEFNGTNNYTANGYFGNYWYSLRDLFAGSYTYRWIINNSLGTTNSTGIINYTVSKKTPSVIMIPDPTWSITYGTISNVTCYNTTPYQSSSIILYRNSGLVSNPDVQTSLQEGTHNYTCVIGGSQNYTSYSFSNNLIVSPSTFTPSQNQGTTPTQNTTGSFTITSSSSSITVVPNSSKVVTFTLSNKFSYDIININLSVSGIESSWYSLDKTSILRLRHDSGVNTTQLTLNVPSDAERKIYSIVFTASGKDFNLNKITRQTTVSLRVPAEVNETNLNETNETANETTEETISNETNITTGSTNENNGILNLLTGLSIKPEDFKNVVLFVGLIAVGLIFLFRSNITEFLTSSVGHRVQKGESKEEKKTSKISSLKNKLSKYSGTRLVIHVKKEEKKEKEKV